MVFEWLPKPFQDAMEDSEFIYLIDHILIWSGGVWYKIGWTYHYYISLLQSGTIKAQ